MIKALGEGFNTVLNQVSSPYNDTCSPKDGELDEETACFKEFNDEICFADSNDSSPNINILSLIVDIVNVKMK